MGNCGDELLAEKEEGLKTYELLILFLGGCMAGYGLHAITHPRQLEPTIDKLGVIIKSQPYLTEKTPIIIKGRLVFHPFKAKAIYNTPTPNPTPKPTPIIKITYHANKDGVTEEAVLSEGIPFSRCKCTGCRR